MSITWQQRQLVTSFLLTLSLYLSCEAQLKAQAQTSEDTSNNYPDPIALLDGVVAARASIPPSSLKLEIATEDNVSIHTNTYQVDFDKEHRRYRLEKDGQKIYDGIYDGQKIICYNIEPLDSNPHGWCEFREITDGTYNFHLFDPRLLGDLVVYTPEDSITTFMFQGQRRRFTTIETKGKVEIDGNDAWHVDILLDGSYSLEFWIDPSRDFRIYKIAAGNHRITKSRAFYENTSYPWIPSKVIKERFEQDGSFISKNVMTILKAEEKEFPEGHWTLEGMDLPRGTVINDYSKAEQLGYWDGKKISKEFVPRDRKPNRKTQWTFILSLAVLITVIFWIGKLKKQKKQP